MPPAAHAKLAKAVAGWVAGFNDSFDEVRFLRAAGVSSSSAKTDDSEEGDDVEEAETSLRVGSNVVVTSSTWSGAGKIVKIDTRSYSIPMYHVKLTSGDFKGETIYVDGARLELQESDETSVDEAEGDARYRATFASREEAEFTVPPSRAQKYAEPLAKRNGTKVESVTRIDADDYDTDETSVDEDDLDSDAEDVVEYAALGTTDDDVLDEAARARKSKVKLPSWVTTRKSRRRIYVEKDGTVSKGPRRLLQIIAQRGGKVHPGARGKKGRKVRESDDEVTDLGTPDIQKWARLDDKGIAAHAKKLAAGGKTAARLRKDGDVVREQLAAMGSKLRKSGNWPPKKGTPEYTTYTGLHNKEQVWTHATALTTGSRRLGYSKSDEGIEVLDLDEVLAEARTSTGKRVPSLKSDAYRGQTKASGWTRTIDARDDHRVLKKKLPGFTKQDHLDAAAHHASRAKKLSGKWSDRQDAAHNSTFGNSAGFDDYKVSGVGREEYGEKDKSRLRTLARASSDSRRLAASHWKAAGKRSRMPEGVDADDVSVTFPQSRYAEFSAVRSSLATHNEVSESVNVNEGTVTAMIPVALAEAVRAAFDGDDVLWDDTEE
jgi:hypothetical protein